MSFWSLDETESPTRLLARALAQEAVYTLLGLPVPPAPPRPPAPEALPSPRTRRRWTRQSVLDTLVAFVRRTGRFPRDVEWSAPAAHGLPARHTVCTYWGTLEAVRAAVRQAVAQPRTVPEHEAP